MSAHSGCLFSFAMSSFAVFYSYRGVGPGAAFDFRGVFCCPVQKIRVLWSKEIYEIQKAA